MQNFKISPVIKGRIDQDLEYTYTIAYQEYTKQDGKKGEFIKSNKTLSFTAFKSESWLTNRKCNLACPTNCTDWYYIQKSVNPGDADIWELDTSLKIVTKGKNSLELVFKFIMFKSTYICQNRIMIS